MVGQQQATEACSNNAPPLPPPPSSNDAYRVLLSHIPATPVKLGSHERRRATSETAYSPTPSAASISCASTTSTLSSLSSSSSAGTPPRGHKTHHPLPPLPPPQQLLHNHHRTRSSSTASDPRAALLGATATASAANPHSQQSAPAAAVSSPSSGDRDAPPLINKNRSALRIIDGSDSVGSDGSCCASSEDDSVVTARKEALNRALLAREHREQEFLRYHVDMSQCYEQRGDVLGAWHVLEHALKQAQHAPFADELRRAYLQFCAGRLAWKLGHYAHSWMRLQQAQDAYEQDDEGKLLYSETLVEIYVALGQVTRSRAGSGGGGSGGTTSKSCREAKKFYMKALRTIELDGLLESNNTDERANRSSIQLLQAKVLRQLGSVLLEMEKYEKAFTALNEAKQLQEALLGHWHVEYASTLVALGQWHEAAEGDYASAAGLYLDALDIYRNQSSIGGCCRVDMAVTLSRIGWLYYLNKDYEDARCVYQEAYDLMMVPALSSSSASAASSAGGSQQQQQHHHHHPNIASLHLQIGMIYAATHQYDRALKRYKKALDIQRHIYGDNQEPVAHTLCLVASIYFQQQQQRQPLQSQQQQQPPQSPASLQQRQQRLDEKAVQCVHHALQIRVELFGRWHVSVGKTCVELGRLLIGMGKARDAVESISKALEIYNSNNLPASHPLMQEAHAAMKKQTNNKKKTTKKKQQQQ